ncbi:hypothetical protein OH76DRAFT_1400497 [Lentinus brumalis]|uniref:Uncharacterized protein n=1 Tax=Lentinus brumalis TaxID=2498619 RepID=A0A371DHY7_9APHY|nr:hypothetical protein OH76DRAFT_1400497 [Polyporus brumalis]
MSLIRHLDHHQSFWECVPRLPLRMPAQTRCKLILQFSSASMLCKHSRRYQMISSCFLHQMRSRCSRGNVGANVRCPLVRKTFKIDRYDTASNGPSGAVRVHYPADTYGTPAPVWIDGTVLGGRNPSNRPTQVESKATPFPHIDSLQSAMY